MSSQKPIEGDARHWGGRPVLAFLVKAAVYVIPILAAIATSIWLSRSVLPRPGSWLQVVFWWVAILVSSTAVLFVVDRLARRFLPLAALLSMSMVFPDQAPSRFRTALRSGSSVKQLTSQLAEAERVGVSDDRTRAAELVLELATALNAHDPRTRGHAERVRAYSEMLAEEMGVDDEGRAKLRWAALMHDIGKLKVPGEVLNKPGKLDDDEWELIKKHPVYGADLVAPMTRWLGEWAGAITEHHERYDGYGYPTGLKGEDISLGGRIVSVADAYDVMTTVRSYKKPMPAAVAREELARHAGTQFDPGVVRAFLAIAVGRLRWVAGPLSWVAQLPFMNFAGVLQQVGTTAGVAAGGAAAVATGLVSGIIVTPDDVIPEVIPPPPPPVVSETTPPTTAAPLPPVVYVTADDSFEVPEDEPRVLSVLANDDVAAGARVAVVSGPSGGVAVVMSDGSISYTPQPDFSGTDRIVYRVTHPDGSTSDAVVSVQVTAVNDLPLAADDGATVNEDGTVVIPVLGNDTDVEGLDPATLIIVQAPLNGTAVVAGGAVTYTPAANFAGTDAFVYEVADVDGAVTQATVTVTVTPVNDLPIARDDSADVAEDSSVVIRVLDNDRDVEGLDLATLSVVQPPLNGTTSIESGRITYVPNTDFNGTDAFVYEVADLGGARTQATVTVRVTPVNDPPIAADDAIVIDEDGTATIDVLANDADTEGLLDAGTLTVTVPPAFGTTLVADGRIQYVPAADFNGTDAVSYRVCDVDGLCAVGRLTVTVLPVNDLPVVPGPGLISLTEDDTFSFDPLAGATDVDGDLLVLASYDTVSDRGGTITAGSLVYTPPANYDGVDTFTYRVTDGVGETGVAVTVVVSDVDHPPVVGPRSVTTAEDTAVVVDLLAGVTDADADAVFVASFDAVSAAGGTVGVAGDGTVTYTPAADHHGTDSFGYLVSDGTTAVPGTVTVTVTPVNDPPNGSPLIPPVTEDAPAVIDIAGGFTDVDGDPVVLVSFDVVSAGGGSVSANGDGTVTYLSAPDYFGVDSFSYTVGDGTASVGGMVAFAVLPVAEDPVAVADSASVAEDDPAGVVIDLLANDYDPDGDPVTLDSYDTSGVAGALTHLGAGSFRYVPAPHWWGVDSFTYVVADGTGRSAGASVTIEVSPVPDAPEAAADAYTTDKDVAVAVAAPGVLGNDGDYDGDPLAVVLPLLDGPDSGSVVMGSDGGFTYTPNAGFVGVDSFTYQAEDPTGLRGTATVTVVVDSGIAVEGLYLTAAPSGTGFELSPVPEPNATPIPDYDLDTHPGFTILPSGGDPAESDPNRFVEWIYAPAGTVELFGPVVLELWSTIEALQAGTPSDLDAVLFECASDGSGCVQILEYHQHVGDWNQGLADWGARTFTLGHADLTIPPTRVLKLKLMFGHTPVWVAMAGENPGEWSRLLLTEANRPPDLAGVAVTVDEDSGAVTLDPYVVDINPDFGSMSFPTPPGLGTVADRGDGSFDYTPTADAAGLDSFVYRLCDTSAACATAAVDVTIEGLNDPPEIQAIGPITIDELLTLSFTAVGSDPNDTPADTLEFSLSGAPAAAGINAATGAFSWATTEPDGPNTYTFDIVVTDDGTDRGVPNPLSDSTTVSVTVNEVNTAPSIASVPASLSGVEGSTFAFTATATDADQPAQTLLFSLQAGTDAVPAGATIDPNLGTFSWTPTEAQGPGSWDIKVRVADSYGGSADAALSLSVSEDNVAPQMSPTPGHQTLSEGDSVSVAVTISDADLPAQTLTVTPSLPAFATFTDGDSDGTWDLEINPGAGDAGVYASSIAVSDGTATVTASFDITVGSGNIVINEAFAKGNELEFIELYNPTSAAIDLTGWRLRDSDIALPVLEVDYTFPAVSLPAGEFAVFWLDPSVPLNTGSPAFFEAHYTTNGGDLGADDHVFLYDSTNALIDYVAWGNPLNPPPPTVWNPVDNARLATDIGSVSIALIPNGADVDSSVCWEGTTVGGSGCAGSGATISPFAASRGVAASPGSVNSDLHQSPQVGSVVLNEVLVTETVNGIGNEEFIEIYNTSAAAIDLAGWMVADSLIPVDGLDGKPVAYTIPAGSLDPGRYAVVWVGAAGPGKSAPGAQLEFWAGLNHGLDESGDDLWLFDAFGHAVDYVAWWDSGGPGSQVGTAPPVSWAMWSDNIDVTFLPDLVSISLTPNGVDGNDPDCWERTGSGSAGAAGCPGAVVTADTHPSFTASAGSTNTVTTATASGIVISELDTTGATDFVELYNPTGAAVDISGFELWVYAGDLSVPGAAAVTLPADAVTTALLPYHHYLIGPAGIAPDLVAAIDIARYGGVQLRDGIGGVVDSVGTNGRPGGAADEQGAASIETNGVPPLTPGVTQSLERRHGGGSGNCLDSDVNAADFVHNLGSNNPQSFAAGPAPCGGPVPPPPSSATSVVISELRGDGPGGGDDEFVELYNPTGVTVSLDKVEVEFYDGGVWTSGFRFDGDAELAPGEHLLLASPAAVSGGSVPFADAQYGPAAPGGQVLGSAEPGVLKNGGAVRLIDDNGAVWDLVGMDSSPAETTALPKFDGRALHTYERRGGGAFGSCVDTGDNLADFSLRLVQDPQGLGDIVYCP